MPRILQLADDFAERFAFERTRVAGYVKALREAGRIKTGPHGVNAPNATTMDAARILIAMMLRPKLHEVAESVELFGKFKIIATDGKENEYPAHCEDALAKALEFYGNKAAQGDTSRFFTFRIHFDHAFATMTVSVWAGDDDPRLEDESFSGFDEVELRYLHPEFAPSLENGAELTPALRAAWRRYRSGFHEVPMLDSHDLAEIGQVIAGHIPPKRPEK